MLTQNHAELTLEVAKHLEADALIKGEYWDGSKGCFIGCLTHSSDPAPAFERFGLPESLLGLCENIFEALPEDEGRTFFAALPNAVGCDGKDLSLVHFAFLAAELRALPPQTGDVKKAVDRVIAGMDLLASGGRWPKAAASAASAAYYAASAAYYAASSASYAASAASAAYYAASAAYYAADAAYYAAYAASSASYYAADASYYAADAASSASYAASAASAAYYAASAAYYAADAADAAYYAASAAADAASADAASADAARIRQRDTLISLISSAPMGVNK
jgi:hypothetical protein